MKRVKVDIDLTTFPNAASFEDVIDHHGLSYDGLSGEHPDGAKSIGIHKWSGRGLVLETRCDPVTGIDACDSRMIREAGYASYVSIIGPSNRVKALYEDIRRVARIKGDDCCRT